MLPAAEVRADQLRRWPPGASAVALDSARLSRRRAENVADVLTKTSGVYMKSYGLGSLATPAVRGGGAAQTAAVWNGFPLQSPLLGLLDFALLPAFFVDELSVQYGGNTASWGSGAIGGAVLLDNVPVFHEGFSVEWQTTLGSFGRRRQAAALRYGNGRLAGATRLFWEKANNNFPYRALPGLPVKRQENARLEQKGLLQELFWKINPTQELTLRAWLQGTDRQIPPTIVQTRSAAEQTDATVRTALHWKKTGKTSVIQARAAFFSEKLDYRDPLILLESASRFDTWTAEVEAGQTFSRRFRLHGALTHTFTRASTSAYETSPRQHRTAAFAALRRDGRRWQAQLDGRLERVDGGWAPFTPGLGAEIRALPFLKINAKVARHYRLPTFNDRFWQPGGNPGLLPESGWSQELGAALDGKKKRLTWSVSSTAYQRRIHNWILWAQRTGQAFFSPQNIAEVWSRGLENRLDLGLSLPFGDLRLSGGYDYTRSTNEQAIKSPRIEPGAQLFYVPRHRAFGELSFQRKNIQITAFQQYTGAVTGLNEPVPAFGVGSIQAQYDRTFGAWDGYLFVQADNLWDARYQVVERRPMPGRSFQVGLSLGYGKRGRKRSVG